MFVADIRSHNSEPIFRAGNLLAVLLFLFKDSFHIIMFSLRWRLSSILQWFLVLSDVGSLCRRVDLLYLYGQIRVTVRHCCVTSYQYNRSGCMKAVLLYFLVSIGWRLGFDYFTAHLDGVSRLLLVDVSAVFLYKMIIGVWSLSSTSWAPWYLYDGLLNCCQSNRYTIDRYWQTVSYTTLPLMNTDQVSDLPSCWFI